MGLRASKQSFGELLSSAAWADICDILDERIEEAKAELLYESTNEDVWIDIRRVAKNRARLGELLYLREIPKFFFEHYDELERIEEGEKDAGRD